MMLTRRVLLLLPLGALACGGEGPSSESQDALRHRLPPTQPTGPSHPAYPPAEHPPSMPSTPPSHPVVSATLARPVVGRLYCSSPDGPSSRLRSLMRFVTIDIAGCQRQNTNDVGTFTFPACVTPDTVHLKIIYDGQVKGPPQGLSTHLQVMDESHDARSDEIDHAGHQTAGGALDLGDIMLNAGDCELWRMGTNILRDYHVARGASPPAGELRIKRWGGVYGGSDAVPYTFYNYIVVDTDYVSSSQNADARERGLFHEFGHTVRHVADGDLSHWDWDNFRWAYARRHDGSEVFNVQYAFNEGWADYWSQARFHPRRRAEEHNLTPGFRDWNENLIANYLIDLSAQPGVTDAMMVQVLEANPGSIHSLHEFEVKLAVRRGLPAPPAPAQCPPGYTDDGATCRKDVVVVSKPSYTRGAGAVPSCGSSLESDAGLCYPRCAAGYQGVGPVCWQSCPNGYHDDGATCRRDASIISADNSSCPWYDECGLTFAQGCSRCPSGYHNDGCTCRRDADIFGKHTYGRGVGSTPYDCGPDRDYDAGLSYPHCQPHYHGVGPVCWGTCPEGYEDHGATCYIGTSILVKY